MTNIEELTEWQRNVGYKYGEWNPVAFLGLFGEAGEVLSEIDLNVAVGEGSALSSTTGLYDIEMEMGRGAASQIDRLKKEIRDNPELRSKITIDIANVPALLVEMSDVAYYLNALCIEFGLTLDSLCKISLEKVKAKQQQNISMKP